MEYTLNKNGWHVRLQKWTFGNDAPEFNNFCPFFWLTIFCALVSPIVGVGKLLFFIGKYIVSPVAKVIDLISDKIDLRYAREINTYVNNLSDWEAYLLFKTIYDWNRWYDSDTGLDHLLTSSYYWNMSSSKQSKLRDRFDGWQQQNKDWKDRILRSRKQELDGHKAKKKQVSNRKQLYSKIAQYTKLFVLLPIGAGLIYLIYFIALVVLFVMENPVQSLYGFLFAAGIIGAYIFGRLIVSISDGGTVPKVFRFVFGPIGRGIKEVFGFLAMNFKAFKDNYCPGIKWLD